MYSPLVRREKTVTKQVIVAQEGNKSVFREAATSQTHIITVTQGQQCLTLVFFK